jgi:ATP-dependent helicase/DNAse subunit B
VLRLDEEPDDEEVMDPRRQGQFVHDVFEAFFGAWQQRGEAAITPANLDRARALFAEVVHTKLTRLPPAEAEVQRTHLLGSAAATGLGEAVLRMEAERDVPVVGRLLERRLEEPIALNTPGGSRTVELKGKADRIDLLADGTFRLIDYKLGWPPKGSQALQLGVYAIGAEQQLTEHGRSWKVGEAVYLAFKGPRRVTPLFATPADRDRILAEVQVRVADTLDRIGRGEFPPHPEDVFHCERCAFGTVCRKDYVGDV